MYIIALHTLNYYEWHNSFFPSFCRKNIYNNKFIKTNLPSLVQKKNCV